MSAPVGRDAELAALASQLASARQGRGGGVVLVGEPGIGKTTLADVASARARDENVRVLWGRCSGLGTAWEPIAQALGPLVDDPKIDIAACGGGLLAVLPEAARRAPELVAPVGADVETIEFGVARAATKLLRQACLSGPCLLVIDDVHDADRASLRLLVHLLHEARTMALLVLMTAREGELSANRHAEEVSVLSRNTIRIDALPDRDARVLVERVAPSLEPAATTRVLAAAEGNPLYLGELAALMRARATTAEEELPIPVGVRASIRSRLERLPPAPRTFVDALAVLGGHAPSERAAEVAGVASSAATLATEIGIVISASRGVCRLSHALVREVAYASLPDDRRTAFHRKAADLALVRVQRGEHDAATEYVRHLVGCGAIADAIDAAMVAARAAELHAADDEAVAILEVVQSASERTGVDDRHHAQLAIALGRALLRSGRGDAGVASCKRAFAIAERIDDMDLLARAALARGSVFRFGHVDRGLVDALRTAVARRGAKRDAIHARLQARLAAAEIPSHDPWPHIASAHESFALARELGDEHVLLDVLHDGMAACIDYEHPNKRVGPNRELRDLSRKLRAPWYELRALSRLIFDYTDLGSVAMADSVLDELDTVARSFAHPRHQWRVAMLRALRATSDGRWAAADRHAEEALALGGDDPMMPIAMFGNRFSRLLAQGRPHDALQLLDEEREILAAIPDVDSMLATFEAGAAARAGDVDRVRRLLPVAQRFLTFDDPAFASLFAHAAVIAGDRDACAVAEAKLKPHGDRFASGGPMFMYVAEPIDRYLGLLAAQRGDRERAIELLDGALAKLRAARAQPYVATTGLDLAALLASGSPAQRARAAELIDEAKAIAVELDLVDLHRRLFPAGETSARGFQLVNEGEVWAITNAGRTYRLRDSRGLRVLAKLVASPGTDIHVLDLIDEPDGGVIDRGDAGPALDAKARAEYRARLIDLRDDLVEAERRGDVGWIDRLRTESEFLQCELSRAFSKAGKPRRTGVAAERARSAITRRVRDAIAKIKELDSSLGEHLEATVRTGTTCSYRGNPQ